MAEVTDSTSGCALPRIRTTVPICGGSGNLDSPLIVDIIAKTAVCLPCVASKTGMSQARAVEALDRIRSFMVVEVDQKRCAGCLNVRETYRIADQASRVAGPPPSAQSLTTLSQALWRFLEDHRGQMFCTQCIANSLFATKRIDRAILGAEGRGARRRYGACASCGKERLLCGLME